VAVPKDATTLVEQPVVESAQTKGVMTMAEYPAASTARVFAVQDTALVMASTSSPSLSLAGRLVDDQHLVDEVVQEFDATPCLSELFAAWSILAAGMTSFRNKLQVDVFFPCFLILSLLLFFCLYYLYFFFIQGLLLGPLKLLQLWRG
jgi:hypothetical protein